MFWLMFLVLIVAAIHVNAKYASPCLTPDQQPGFCMPVKSCKTVYDFFTRISQTGEIISEHDKSKLASLHCGTFKNVAHVCCHESEIQLNAEGLNILKDTTCGVYLVNTVANGLNASLFQFPWMALLKYDDPVDPFKCGGTLISDQYILTAAHCVKGREHFLKAVRLGEFQISTPVDCTNVIRKKQCAPPVEDVEIEEVIIHENYQSIYNDIALIRLRRKVEFKRHIKPICLPIYENLRTKEHENYVLTGWGKTENDTTSDVLLTAFVPRVNRLECENQLREYKLRHPLNDGHVCAGGRNLVDSCRGDSGGPLGYRDFYDKRPRFIQFGIVSIGVNKCGVVNIPGIYTNISHYIQWITDNLKENSGIAFIQRSDNQEESCTTPALENGFCVPYKECPYVRELTQNYGSTEAIPKYYLNYIFKSKCSRGNEPIRLCCKLPNNYVKPTMATVNQEVTPSNTDPRLTEDLDYNKDYNSQLNAQGLNILNGLSCGSSGGDRVAGGNETDLAEYPWMALLRYDAPGDEFKCGGSLISSRYVLTATHCVNKGIYPVIGVRLGEHDLSTNPDCRRKGRKNVCSPVVEDFGVEKIITHPKYNERRRINDIALVKLDRNVDFKRHIKPVCLPITKPSYETTTNKFTIAGWGATENSTRSSILLKAEVLGQSRSVCQNVFSSFSIDINLKHICAGDLKTGRDSCRGDSGGPLVGFNTYSDVKRFIQYGIVASGGIACNLEQGFPGIYTNVLTYLPWITNNIVG
ncbi:transmembrane protease serine 9-like [Calliphora vicina]|uniref:transmembrane protease serine 9-like n=1 Tax=Calliphora vicina TaxID=7373 RepID=UPI00325C02DA